jgi:hypothetical protein
MKDIFLSPLPINELEILVENSIRRVLSEQIKTEPLCEIIDREELCKRLAITEPTAIRWEKKGKIPCFRIGSSVRYNWLIVLATLEKKGGSKC